MLQSNANAVRPASSPDRKTLVDLGRWVLVREGRHFAWGRVLRPADFAVSFARRADQSSAPVPVPNARLLSPAETEAALDRSKVVRLIPASLSAEREGAVAHLCGATTGIPDTEARS